MLSNQKKKKHSVPGNKETVRRKEHRKVERIEDKNSENLRIHASELDTNSTSMSETELETEENMSSEETYDEYEDEEITLRKEMSNIEKKIDIIAKRRKERRNERRSKEEKNREKEKTEKNKKNVKRKEIEELREVHNRDRREKPYIDRNWREEKIEINRKDKEWYSRANKEKLPAQIVISQLNIGTSRIEIYNELIHEGSIYDIVLMKSGNKKRCFITFDKREHARNALESIARRSYRYTGTFSGAAVNWAYRDAHGETLIEGSNVRLDLKVDSNNRTRHKVVIEGVETNGKRWKGELLNRLRHERMIFDDELDDIREIEKLGEGCAMIKTKYDQLADRLYLCRPENRETRLTIKRRFNVILREEAKNERKWEEMKEQERKWKEERWRKKLEKKRL